MDLKNMTMDDLKQKLAAVDKKTLIKFGSGFGAIILFLIIFYVILNPMVKERKAKYNDKILKQNEITQFDNEIITFKTRIKKMKPDFDKTSTLFHSKAEVEDLYESLSKYAAVNGLVISKIEKKKPKPDPNLIKVFLSTADNFCFRSSIVMFFKSIIFAPIHRLL